MIIVDFAFCQSLKRFIDWLIEMRPIATDVSRSVVCIWLLGTRVSRWAVQKRLTQSRCRLGADSYRSNDNGVIIGRIHWPPPGVTRRRCGLCCWASALSSLSFLILLVGDSNLRASRLYEKPAPSGKVSFGTARPGKENNPRSIRKWLWTGLREWLAVNNRSKKAVDRDSVSQICNIRPNSQPPLTSE